jgi:4-amino-4-deoxy-L-arabinose transferase-like glycosyltransferase
MKETKLKFVCIMKKFAANPLVQWMAVILLVFSLYCITLPLIPFHPDEATYLYTSTDTEILFRDPFSISYHKGQATSLIGHYRLVDPPMISWGIGIARIISQSSGFDHDWDWSESWQFNLRAGNLPADELLLLSRIAILMLFPFTCYFLYRFGRQMINHWAGLLLVIFFALNPLILLHARRAMPEGILMFFVCLLLMLMTDQKKHILWVPIIFALAINSKQTALFLIPMYLLYGIMINWHASTKQRIQTAISFLLLPLAVTYLLNPVAWSQPLSTLVASIQERQAMTISTQQYLAHYYPEIAAQSHLERFLLLNYHIYFEPLALDDMANYRQMQQAAFDQYLRFPLHSLLRNNWIGITALIATLSAFILQIYQFFKTKKAPSPGFWPWCLVYSGIIFPVAGLCLLSTIYQRYVLVLIPFLTLQFVWLITTFIQNFPHKKPA